MRRALISTAFLFGLLACVGDEPGSSPLGDDTRDGGAQGKPLGTRCGPGEACDNGSCVDGYCCDKPCLGTCEACDLEGREGQCSPVVGEPRHGACEGDASGVCAGSCDGKKVDACAFPEIECAAGSCAGGTATLPSRCEAGTCPAPTTQACALGCFEDSCLGVADVASGYYFTCAALSDKTLRCWGDNDGGQLGQAQNDVLGVVRTPRAVPNLTNVVGIAATFSSACALIGDGTVKCWGSNGSGQLGVAVDLDRHPTPTTVPGISGATFLTGSSGGHFCAIVAGGQLRCWGGGTSGQLGNGGTTSSPVVTVCAPESTTAAGCTPATGATFVVGGDNHTCAVFAGGKVACWGGNESKQLGIDLPSPQPLPRTIPNLTAKSLAAGNRLTCSVDGDRARCWGSGAGKLGNGTNDINRAEPVAVCTKQDCSTLLQKATSVATADESVCAVAGGSVRCWGSNTGGQLGDGNPLGTSQNYAATAAIASGAVRVVSGGGTNYAIVIDGASRDLKCWGDAAQGKCGDDRAAGPTTQATPISPKW
ncbi:MAG: hypothetical protein KF894_11020 [Labilithrix sp.]|nr:hypothetical protein [Labilithrix sp.]